MRQVPDNTFPGAEGPSGLRATVERFEEAWQAGQRPRLEDHLPQGPARRATLVELAHIDLEWRLKAGEAARVEDYLRRFPELAADGAALLGLIEAEHGLRRRAEPGLGAAEYAGRFPALAAALADRLGDDASSRPGEPGAPSTRVEGPPSPGAPAAGPATRGGRYRPVRFHARGGLGEVHVAEDEELHREVALKRIQPRFAADAGSQARFLREAEITARLEHPGVVPVHGLVRDADGRPCYAMRFIQGQTLADAIGQFHAAGRARPDPGERAVALRALLGHFVAVCNTIAYAHSRGVLHRDLKPANVMLGPYGETLVVDWGLAGTFDRGAEARAGGEASVAPASAAGAEETPAGRPMGTPAYMAPEQAAGRWDEVGPATDVYGLGATLYTLLTGQAPFAGPADVFGRARRGEFPPPRQHNRRVPRALEAICLKAMALRPGDRYATAQALADDVQRWLADAPVACYREPLPAAFARWGRRHRQAAAGAFTLLVTAVAGLSVGTYLLSREQSRTEQEKLHAQTMERQAVRLAGEATRERDRAAGAARQARAEADKSDQVSRFLAELFLAADPFQLGNVPTFVDRGMGERLTVRQALDRGASRVDGTLEDEPLTRAALKDAIGNAYRSLGAFDQARAQLEAALRLRQEHRARQATARQADLEEAESLHSLGWWHQDRGDFYEAARLFRRALELRVPHLGEDDPLVANGQFHLGWALAVAGTLDEAEGLFARALATRLKHFGPDHRDVGATYLAQAFLAMQQGRPEAIAGPAARVFAIAQKRPGDKALATAVRQFLQGLLFKQLGLYGPAEGSLRDSRRGLLAAVGQGHPYEGFIIFELADALEQQGNEAEAEKLYRECLDFARRTGNGQHPKVLHAVDAVARLLAKHGKYREGEALFEQMLAEQKRAYKAGSPLLADTRTWQARYATQNNQFARADELARQAHEAHKKSGARTTWAATSASLLGWAKLRARDYAAAEGFFQEALELERRLYGASSANVAARLSELGRALAGQKKYEQAERALRDSIALGRAKLRLPAERLFLAGTLGTLAEVCVDQGRGDEGLTYYQEGLDLFLQHAAAPVRQRADLVSRPMIARMVERGQYRAALPLVEQALRFTRGAKAPEVKAREVGHFVLWAELSLAAAGPEGRAAVCERLLKERPRADGPGDVLIGNVLVIFGGADVRASGWWVNNPGRKPWHVPVLATGSAGLLAAPAAPGPLLASMALLRRGWRVPPRRNVVWGAVAYRAGEYAEAVEALTQPPAGPSGYVAAYGDFFLAMAYHRLGWPREAREALGRAVTWVETVQRGQLGENFLFERLELVLARREAESLLGGSVLTSFAPRPR